jgi:dihydropteroate synthase
MGILNATPDSFYDRGRYGTPERAVKRALQMTAEGADIIDIGGERAGPGEPVSREEELRRVIPVIEAIRKESTIPLSVDTLKPEVARAAMDAGADIINSIGGFDDPALRRVAADTSAAVVVMHIQGKPRVHQHNPRYDDVAGDVRRFLLRRADKCLADGIPANRIMIDPGPGFGKTTEQDITLLRELASLTELPYPVVLAVSRKKFIGDILDAPPEERLYGSLAVLTWGVMNGIRLARVHDVLQSKRVCLMTEAVFDPALTGAKW